MLTSGAHFMRVHWNNLTAHMTDFHAISQSLWAVFTPTLKKLQPRCNITGFQFLRQLVEFRHFRTHLYGHWDLCKSSEKIRWGGYLRNHLTYRKGSPIDRGDSRLFWKLVRIGWKQNFSSEFLNSGQRRLMGTLPLGTKHLINVVSIVVFNNVVLALAESKLLS